MDVSVVSTRLPALASDVTSLDNNCVVYSPTDLTVSRPQCSSKLFFFKSARVADGRQCRHGAKALSSPQLCQSESHLKFLCPGYVYVDVLPACFCW